MRAILTYHSVDASGSPISVDEATFRAHVRWLSSGAVRVVPLESIREAADDAVALTFDDAFRNFADVAWPLLREQGLPVTLFVVTAKAGTSNDWGGRGNGAIPALPLLGWDGLARLADEGVTLGAHSRTHPDLRHAGDDALAEELAGSADDLAARTGRRPAAFAYPYGGVDDRVAAAAQGSFALACTTELRELRGAEQPLRLPRLDTFYLRDADRLSLWGTARLRRYLQLRAGMRRLRAALTGRPA